MNVRSCLPVSSWANAPSGGEPSPSATPQIDRPKNDHIASLVGEMGNMSDSGGQFFGLHMIAVDSDGNIYTGVVQEGDHANRKVDRTTRGNRSRRICRSGLVAPLPCNVRFQPGSFHYRNGDGVYVPQSTWFSVCRCRGGQRRGRELLGRDGPHPEHDSAWHRV